MHKILIIDDETEFLEIAKIYFIRKNFDPICVETIPQAFEALKSNKISAIVSDFLLKDATGADFYRMIEKDGLLVHPFILVTGHKNYKKFIEGINIDKIFFKPVIFSQLVEDISAFLSDQLADN